MAKVKGDSWVYMDVNSYKHLKVVLETDASANPENVWSIRQFNENDSGSITWTPELISPESDIDYRQRVAQDLQLDEEIFCYTAQNTGKHAYLNTTMTNAWTAGQLTTNSGNITTTTTGTLFQTKAYFPTVWTCTLSGDFELAFSAQPTTNTIIDYGFFIANQTNPYAPTDWVYFRLNSSGLQWVVNYNGTESTTGVFPLSNWTGTWTYTNSKRYQFIVYIATVKAVFWVNDGTGAVKLGEINLPTGQARMSMSTGLPLSIRHAISGGAASGAMSALIGAYNVRLGGVQYATSPSVAGNRMYGSYQGLSGGTMGSLATYPNSTNPTAAAPSNTALTANLPAGLWWQGLVTAAAAAATDGIWGSYQVPAGTANLTNRRLSIRWVIIDLVNTGAAVATTATTIQFCLAYWHTAVSLATADGANSKSPRRISLWYATWAVGSAIGSQPQGWKIFMDLWDAPVFVNPWEFVQLVGKFLVGTATASQTINFVWQPIYGWE